MEAGNTDLRKAIQTNITNTKKEKQKKKTDERISDQDKRQEEKMQLQSQRICAKELRRRRAESSREEM
jgi:hypothetical protein